MQVGDLLTLQAVAKRLACSVSHVRALARAAELAAVGMEPQQVSPRLRRYLSVGFPPPRFIGSRRLARIDVLELERWLNRTLSA